ncbi:hypothetical protein GCM10009839_11910 [Catenulispora yoronensis]|uniref:Uncharacterized protein n=1 Tax=Catenulispora yoronensis TaxID=450799 RepID=A0ABN2TQT2_9ACTN
MAAWTAAERELSFSPSKKATSSSGREMRNFVVTRQFYPDKKFSSPSSTRNADSGGPPKRTAAVPLSR